jgi:hypothetical protein
MPRPIRVQLSRRAGFDLQAVSRAANGLVAVNVARPTKWGNPYKKGLDGPASNCVTLFRRFALRAAKDVPGWREELVSELRGKNLACWCKSNASCHADVLLYLANN